MARALSCAMRAHGEKFNVYHERGLNKRIGPTLNPCSAESIPKYLNRLFRSWIFRVLIFCLFRLFSSLSSPTFFWSKWRILLLFIYLCCNKISHFCFVDPLNRSRFYHSIRVRAGRAFICTHCLTFYIMTIHIKCNNVIY